MNHPREYDHDLAAIGPQHPDGSAREVGAWVDGKFYARGSVAELLSAVRSNPDLREAAANETLHLEIDQLGWGERDERSLMFGQAVTLDDLRAISVRR